jgi:hypothetical protein
MTINVFRVVSTAAVALALTLSSVAPAFAQLNTQHLRGGTGLKNGSLPPPGGYFVAPILYVYNTDTLKGREGNEIPVDVSLTSSLFGGGFMYVTTKKVLGANYAFQVLFPVGANNRIQGNEIDQNPGAGITDSVIQPVSLGWHFKRADAMAGYAIFVPTGRFEAGASNNTGFGMWGHELSAGTTVYLTETKQYHAATTVSFDFQSKKKDTETKVGNAMNLEGGVGGDFLKGGLTTGLAYYASFKLTEDQIEGIPAFLIRGKNRNFGLGPEATLALARKNTVYGFLRVAYFWETYARASTQGTGLFIQATFLMRPLKIPPQAP